MFKPNARRDALQLRDKGLVTAEEGEAGFNFFPAGGASPVQKNAVKSLSATRATTRAAD